VLDLQSPHRISANKKISNNKNINLLSENFDDNGNTHTVKFDPDKKDIKDIWGVNDDKKTDFTDFNLLSKPHQLIDSTSVSLFEPSKPHQSIELSKPHQSIDNTPLSLFEPSKSQQYFEPSKPQPLDLFNCNSNDSSINNKHESQVNPFDDYIEEDVFKNNTNTFNNTNSSINTPTPYTVNDLSPPYTVNGLSLNSPVIPVENHDFDFLLSKSASSNGKSETSNRVVPSSPVSLGPVKVCIFIYIYIYTIYVCIYLYRYIYVYTQL
jgi:hypothetical protein